MIDLLLDKCQGTVEERCFADSLVSQNHHFEFEMIVVSLHINYVIFLLQQSTSGCLGISKQRQISAIFSLKKIRVNITLIVFIDKIMNGIIVQEDEEIIEERGGQKIRQTQQIKDNKYNSQAINGSVEVRMLKQKMQNIERERLKSRMQREIQSKQDNLLDLKLKYQQIQKQLLKVNANSKSLYNENKQMKIKIQDLIKELSLHQIKQRQLTFAKLSQQQHQEVSNQCLKKLQQETLQQRKTIQNLKKHNNIALRRIATEKQQKIKSLEGKIQIKTKQQAKIQELLQKKKEQCQKAISEKDNEISSLSSSVSSLHSQINKLTLNLASSQTSIALLQQKCTELQYAYEEQLDNVALKNHQLQNNINVQIQRYRLAIQKMKEFYYSLQKQYQFEQYHEDLPEMINHLREWTIIKLCQNKDQLNKLTAQQQKIQSSKRAEFELQNNISILKQQLQFFKSSHTKNSQFVTSIKAHLALTTQQHKIKTKQVAHGLAKTFSKQPRLVNQNKQNSQLNRNSIAKSTILNEIQKFYPSILSDQNKFVGQKTNELHKSQSHTIFGQNVEALCERRLFRTNSLLPLDSNTKYGFDPKNNFTSYKSQYQSAGIKVAKKSSFSSKQNEVLKEELANKKKQLLYIMYRQQKTSANTPNNVIDKTKIGRREHGKKRSSSTSELVRARCQQQLP